MQVRFVDMLGFDRVFELPEGSTAGQMRTYIMESALYDMSRTDMYRNGKILEGNDPFYSQTFADDNIIVLIDRRRISERSYPKVDYAFPVRAKYPPLSSSGDTFGALHQYNRGEPHDMEDPEFIDDYQAEHDRRFREMPHAFNAFELPEGFTSEGGPRLMVHRSHAARRNIDDLVARNALLEESARYRAFMNDFNASGDAPHAMEYLRVGIGGGRFAALMGDDDDE